jgi:hypothetical protein
MDQESWRASVAYSDMNKQHFNGGYFSPAVREQAKRIKMLSEAEQKAFYKDSFLEALAVASRLIQHPRYTPHESGGGGSIDLSAEGYGVVYIEVGRFKHENESSPAFTTVVASAEAFHPVADTYYEDGKMHPQQHPAFWEEGIYADAGGFLPADMVDGLDLHISRALEHVETLRIVDATLDGRATTYRD